MPLRFQPGVVVGALLFAFAGARGVSKVEARIDQGPWQQAHEADGLRKDGFTRSGRLDSLKRRGLITVLAITDDFDTAILEGRGDYKNVPRCIKEWFPFSDDSIHLNLRP